VPESKDQNELAQIKVMNIFLFKGNPQNLMN